jgi:hypothetical protein
MLEGIHRFTLNPLRGLAFWHPQVKEDRLALKLHDQLLGEKLAAAMKAVPPEHTIAGDGAGQLAVRTLRWHYYQDELAVHHKWQCL